MAGWWPGGIDRWVRNAWGRWFGRGTGTARESSGDYGERLAARHLESNGFVILERRYRTRLGEIDLIARDGEWLVFVEVKCRRGTDKGHPLEAVDARKQRRLIRLAEAYLAEPRRRSRSSQASPRIRFDVVAVIDRRPDGDPVVEHVAHAFRG
jgi:putative endonuclease